MADMWYGLYGPRCPLSPKRPLNLITHSLTCQCNCALIWIWKFRCLWTLRWRQFYHYPQVSLHDKRHWGTPISILSLNWMWHTRAYPSHSMGHCNTIACMCNKCKRSPVNELMKKLTLWNTSRKLWKFEKQKQSQNFQSWPHLRLWYAFVHPIQIILWFSSRPELYARHNRLLLYGQSRCIREWRCVSSVVGNFVDFRR